ncbi:MAG: serine/threonine-protein kinase, partial [Planctomycetota bacterium]
LNPQFQNNDVARQRFCREGRAAAAIAHEHVVSMYHVAKANDGEVAFLVMQLIEGDTLETRLQQQGRLPVQEVARIGMQIAAGLAAAHERSMVHRDIKPANILIQAVTERVKLTDFGLARAADDIKLTKTGMVTGTPLYMSPEQAIGDVPDERSDLFSLGAVMYEMATGVPAFQAPTAVGVMKRIMDLQLESPRQLNSEISQPLSDLIMALLNKKPGDRPSTASEVTSALASIVTSYGPISPLQIPSVPAAEVKRLSGSHAVAQHRWAIAGWVAAAVGLFCLLSAAVIAWPKPDSVSESQSMASASPSGDSLPSAEMNAGQSAGPAPIDVPSIVLAGNPGTVWSVDFAPGGDVIAAASEDGSVRLWDVAKQSILTSFDAHRGVVWTVRFHPTRQMLATSGDDGRVRLWDSNTFEEVRGWDAGNAVRGVAFSPDGDRIFAGDREGGVHVYDINTGEEVASRTQSNAIFNIDISPDGKWIATVGSDGIVRMWNSETLESRRTMSGHRGPIYNVRFSADGKLLASVGWGKDVR